MAPTNGRDVTPFTIMPVIDTRAGGGATVAGTGGATGVALAQAGVTGKLPTVNINI
jgi:hypothetical protein